MDMLLRLLKAKVDSIESESRNSCFTIDKMEIATVQECDTSSKSFIGNTILGGTGIAKHYTL